MQGLVQDENTVPGSKMTKNYDKMAPAECCPSVGTCENRSRPSESDRTGDSLRRPAPSTPAPTWQEHTAGLHEGQAAGEQSRPSGAMKVQRVSEEKDRRQEA